MRNRLTACGLLSAMLAATLTAVSFPARPAQAVSTAREIQAGQAEDKQITQRYDVIKDQLLNRWVNETGEKLWSQTARKDVPYNIKILDANDVNAFSTLGGYIYVNAGTLDFVQSDDELAGVIGHETGHIERRHAVVYPAKAEALDLLLGITSLLSPIVGGFGQAAEAGILAKASRTQEVQADQYGLLLMSRAGYDPDAMISFMNHLGAAHEEADDDVDKYLADHPGFPERVARLSGYAEIDRKRRTEDQLLVQALHDQKTARYPAAAVKLRDYLAREPNDATARLRLGETQIALGLPNKAEQTLALAAAQGSAKTREQALSENARLADDLARFTPVRRDVAALRATLDQAPAHRTQIAAELARRQDPGKDQIKTVQARLRNLSLDAPALANVGARPSTRAGAILKNVASMSRSVAAAFDKAKETLDGAGFKDEEALIREMREPLLLDVTPPQSLSVLSAYPSMLADLDRADEDMLQAVDASRSALTLLEAGLDDLNGFLRRLKETKVEAGSDLPQSEYAALLPLMSKAGASLDKAALAGAQARERYNAARARRLQTRITMLGLTFPRERYETLRYALRERFKNEPPSYDEMLREGLSPGEIAAASVVAADTHLTPRAVIQEAHATHTSIVDLAETRGMSTFSLEIFLDLVYLDYTDDPLKEAHDAPNAAPTVDPLHITER